MDRYEAERLAKELLDKPSKKGFDDLEKQVNELTKKVNNLEERISKLEK